ncbi:hypothetical protein ACWIDS_17875 [Dietzia maris]
MRHITPSDCRPTITQRSAALFDLKRTRTLLRAIAGIVVVTVLVVCAPFMYRAARSGDDAPPNLIDDRVTDVAAIHIHGTWVVVPDTPPN